MVWHPRNARLALRLPRKRGLRADRKTGLRRFPAHCGRRIQPAVQPLLEYHEGRGAVWFCQLDVTGRSEPDPVAERLVDNLLQYALAWRPVPARQGVYAGEPEGHRHFAAAGFDLRPWDDRPLTGSEVLVVTPGGGQALRPHADMLGAWLQAGGRLLAIGLEQEEANTFLPTRIQTRQDEHIAAYFEPFGYHSLIAGIGPADVHNRDPRVLPLVTEGADMVGNGVLAWRAKPAVVFCQLVPWRFNYQRQYNVKRTYRRAAFTVTRLAANLGVPATTPLLARFATPAAATESR